MEFYYFNNFDLLIIRYLLIFVFKSLMLRTSQKLKSKLNENITFIGTLNGQRIEYVFMNIYFSLKNYLGNQIIY